MSHALINMVLPYLPLRNKTLKNTISTPVFQKHRFILHKKCED